MLVIRHHLMIVAICIAPVVCAAQDSGLVPSSDPSAANAPLPLPGSEEAPPVTLSDLQGLAFQHNPTLAAAAARMDAARGRKVQAGLYPNPVVGYHGTEIGNLNTAGQQGGFINQRFITADKLRLDRAAAGKEIDEAHFRFHAQEQRILTDVSVRFYEALAAQRRVQIAHKLAQIGDDLVVATEKLLAGQLRTENDLLQAQIRSDEAHILRDNAENELDEAWRRLMAVVGTPTAEIAPLAGLLEADVPDFSWDECSVALLADNPELSAARARAERTRVLISRARKEPIPNVDVSISVRHIIPTDSDVANVQVGVPIPVFNKNQGNIRSAEADWIAACREIQRIELQLQDQLAVAFRRYANAREQAVRYSESILPRAEKSLNLVTSGYERGQVEYLTLLTAQQTYLQVNLAYINALRELRTASSLIDGRLLDGSLAAGR